MAIPTLITDLSTTASSNPPAGSESTIEGDNHIRAAYAFIAQNYSEKAPKASPTFTGTPAAPTAAADTNTTQIATTAYVVGQGYAKLASPTFTGTVTAAVLTTTGNTTLGNASTDTLNVGNGGIIKDASGNVGIGANPLLTAANRTVISINGTTESLLALGIGGTAYCSMLTTTAGLAINHSPGYVAFNTDSVERMRIDATGNIIYKLVASAPALSVNSQMVFALTSNTNLQISVRGTDGVTRTANITLA